MTAIRPLYANVLSGAPDWGSGQVRVSVTCVSGRVHHGVNVSALTTLARAVNIENSLWEKKFLGREGGN